MFSRLFRLIIIGLFLCVPVLAQNKIFLNFEDRGNGEVHISQSATQCENSCLSVKLSSYSQTAQVLDTLLQKHWNLSTNQDGRIFFDSDIDLGQIGSDNSSCVVNHKPLTFKAKWGQIFGGNHTITNLCYKTKIDYGSNNVRMTDTVGFFKMLDTVWVDNLNFKKVRISVTDLKNTNVVSNGCNYLPVGTLAGIMDRSLLNNTNLDDVEISAPMAGGLLGFVNNSTLENVHAQNIVVRNEVNLGKNSGKAGSRVLANGGGNGYNVYIGGLVGLSMNLNLSNVNANVTVEDKSSEKISAVGGLVGHFSVSKKLSNIPTDFIFVENANVGRAKISGALASGGFLGELGKFNNSSENYHDVIIRNSSFSGDVVASDRDSVYFGGLVGRSALDCGSSLEIISSQANARLYDTLKTSTKHYVFAGGLVGLSIYWSGMNRVNDGLSIVNSKTSGEINVSKGANASGVKADVYLGGFVGSAHVAQNDSAFLADTSSMKISSLVSGADKGDSVSIGGFVGRLLMRRVGSNNYTMNFRKSMYTGEISVNDSMSHVRVGGLVGNFPAMYDHLNIGFENVRVQTGNVLSLNKSRQSVPVNGRVKMGGLCGECYRVLNVDHASVDGYVNVGGDFANGDSLLVGGLFGNLHNGSDYSFDLRNAYFVGSINVPKAAANREKSKIGYVIGGTRIGYSTAQERSFISVYHFGEDSFDAVGEITDDSYRGNWAGFLQQSSISKQKWTVQYIVRNGASKKLSDWNIGTETESNMKSANFAAFLNKPWSTGNVWKFVSGTNSNLPVFESENLDYYLLSSSSMAMSSSSKKSSSSSAKSSSSVKSNSSAAKSSSSVKKSSSSAAKSSSSVKKSSSSTAKSSSSVLVTKPTFVKPSFKQSGNIIKMTFGAKFDGSRKTSARIRVKNDSTVVKDTVLIDSLPKVLKDTAWTLAPAPVGKYDVELVLKNSKDSVLYKGSYELKSQVDVAPKQWKLVSLAYSEVKKLDLKKNDALYAWNEKVAAGEFWQYYSYVSGSKIDSSRGFWLGSIKGTALPRKTEKLPKNTEFVWKLDSVYSGWNLVANPHGWNIELPNLKKNKIEIWRWNPETSEYEEPKYIGPYEGVWIKSGRSLKLTMPGTPYFAPDSSVSLAKFGGFNGENLWSIRAVLTDLKGKRDSWNVFGAGENFEAEEPPEGMGDRVNLFIAEGKKMLAKSIRQSASEMEWTLMVKATDERFGYLNLEGIENLWSLGLRAFVTVDGYTKEVQAGESLPLLLKSSATPVKVRVASSERKLAADDLSFARSVHIGDYLEVSFYASEILAGVRGKVEILDMNGKVVSYENVTTTNGVNKVNVPARICGLYVLRVQVGSKTLAKNIFVE